MASFNMKLEEEIRTINNIANIMHYKFYTTNCIADILEDVNCVNSPIYELCISIHDFLYYPIY